MASTREMLVRLFAATALLTAVAGLAGSTVAYSTLISAMIGLGMALAYARTLRRADVAVPLIVVAVILAALFAAAAAIHGARAPLRIALGFPVQTSLFVWGIWPLGAVFCVLHALRFDHSILPEREVGRLLENYRDDSEAAD